MYQYSDSQISDTKKYEYSRIPQSNKLIYLNFAHQVFKDS